MPPALSLIVGLVFLAFAAVQYNDPDWYIWIPLYLVPTVLGLAAFRGHYFVMPAAVACIGFVVFQVYWSPGTFQAFSFEVEEWREVLGLGLCGIWCLAIVAVGMKMKKRGIQGRVQRA